MPDVSISEKISFSTGLDVLLKQGGRFGMQYPIGLKGVSHAMAMYYGKVAGENAVNEV